MVSTDFRTGSPNWIDLGSPDLAESELFYGAVFGWTFESGGPAAGGYGFFRNEGRTVAAAGPLTEAEALPAWTVYFRTEDADGTAAAVTRAGGTVRVPPSDVPAEGRFAQFTDPTGGNFAVWQPGRTRGLEAVGETGAMCWAELHTSDAAEALRFYRALFGWRTRDSGVPGVDYTVLSTAEGEDPFKDSFGGVAGVHPRVNVGWLAHFAVADALLTTDQVRTSGGSVVVPPEQVPTVGRIAVLADPFGAQFAILEPEPRR
ncbi:VOC family protein [Kitasatospora sp. CB02891]|uniref:VOC family protein n=1 Tax=Kitasatospora sp. CB02891 TaxID=2020329 RepID=UPI000C27F4AE|nr:VOC family protein [Kitasatospora sp. CB02891]PJN25082.1 hydroxylase [Kitasatospora sp. CB02891]